MMFYKAVIYLAAITSCTLRANTNPVFVLSTAFAATLLILGIAAAGVINSASAQQQKFTIKLSGSNEVPPVNTAGTGVASFKLSQDGKSLDYQLNVTKMNSVMGAHIHSGKQGENGPVVAGLFNPAMNGPPTGAVNGQLSKGTITAADLQGPLAGKQISDLINMLKTGGAYVNVHTSQNQNGELRGQVSSGNTTSNTPTSSPSAATTTSSPRY
jgi:CHRD domain